MESTPEGRRRRAVLDGARRKVERALLADMIAAEMAAAAEAVLAEPKLGEVPPAKVAALRAAVERYRALG